MLHYLTAAYGADIGDHCMVIITCSGFDLLPDYLRPSSVRSVLVEARGHVHGPQRVA